MAKHKKKAPKRKVDGKAKPDRAIETREALAVAIGVSAGTVSRYLDRDDWPVRRVPPWSVKELATVMAWREGMQEDRAADDAANVPGLSLLTRSKISLNVERAKTVKLHREIEQGKYLLASDVSARSVRQVLAVKQALLDLANGLPLQLTGKEPPEIHAILKERVYGILNAFAKGTPVPPFSVNEPAGLSPSPTV